MIRRSFASKFSGFSTTSRQNRADYRQRSDERVLPPHPQPGSRQRNTIKGLGRQGLMPTRFIVVVQTRMMCDVGTAVPYSRIRTFYGAKQRHQVQHIKIFQDFYVYCTSVNDQDEDIIHIQIIWPFLVAATSVVLVCIRAMKYELTCCVPCSADYERLDSSKGIGSAVRAPRGDESVHSPALIYMLSLVLCVPRKTKLANS